MPPSNAEEARWFYQHVQPHEPKLRAWLALRFPTVQDTDDLIQETYLRLFRSPKVGNLEHPKAYLFTTAKNAALDRLRRRAIPIAPLGIRESAVVLEEAAEPSARLIRADDLQLLHDAIEALPERCRLVFKLRKLFDASYAQIAQQLGISEKTVCAQLAIGIEKVRAYLMERGVP